MEVGDLVKRKTELAEEIGELWLIVDMEKTEHWEHHCFVTIMNIKSQALSKYLVGVIKECFEKI